MSSAARPDSTSMAFPVLFSLQIVKLVLAVLKGLSSFFVVSERQARRCARNRCSQPSYRKKQAVQLLER